MRRNRKWIGATLLLLMGCLPTQADTALKIFVTYQELPTEVILLTNNPVITFNDGRISISYTGGNTSMLIDDVDHWEFGEASATVDVDDELAEEPVQLRLRFTGQNTVCIENATDASRIGIYSIDGKAQPFTAERTPTGINISLTHLRQGTYIIRTEQQSFKILKQR